MEWAKKYVGQLVALQFKGQLILYTSTSRGSAMMPEPVIQEDKTVAVQSIDGVRLEEFTKDVVRFSMRHPDGSEVECAVDPDLVATVWLATKLKSSILA